MADGSLLIGGSFNAFNGQETPLGRLFDTGAPDPTFLPKIQIEGNIEAIVRQADGSLVLGGNFTEYSGAPVHRIVRLSATGMLDVAYSAATGLLPARVTCLALQPDGKVLAGTDRGLRRLFTTGSPDAGYGSSMAGSYISALAVQADGRAIVGGYFATVAGGNSSLARLTTSGDLDTSFVPANTNNPGDLSVVDALLPQADGKLLLAGYFRTPTNNYISRVVRYESTGALDASFSTSTAFGPISGQPEYTTILNALALQPDGKVLVGGSFGTVGGVAQAGVTRLTTTGTPDVSFQSGLPTIATVYSLALQPNGRVLVGGGFTSPTTNHLARLLPSGQLDASFTATANPNRIVLSVLVQPDGGIMLGGYFTAVGGQPAVSVARITAPNVLAVAAPTALAMRTEVWPVPAHGLLHVAPDAHAQPRTVELCDALGRRVRTLPVTNVTDLILDIAGLPTGVYLLRVHYAAGTATRQVAIQ